MEGQRTVGEDAYVANIPFELNLAVFITIGATLLRLAVSSIFGSKTSTIWFVPYKRLVRIPYIISFGKCYKFLVEYQDADNLLEVNSKNGTTFQMDFPVNTECWPKCAENFTKVILVRHPLDRLLSAFLYIFENPKGKFYYKVTRDLR